MKPIAILLLLTLTCVQANAMEAVVFNGTHASAENKLIAMTVAGIVNREQPRLYLLNVYETWSYNQTDASWQAIYEEEGGVAFNEITEINELVQHFIDDLNGAITYDPSLTYGNFEGQVFRWQGELAMMLGGLTDCIPLPYADQHIDIDRPDSISVPDHFHGQSPIPVSARLEESDHSWNDPALSQKERYLLGLDWALEHLLPRSNPEKFYLREITDWAVNQRMFQLNLAGTETLNFYSLPDEKAEKIEQVMSYMLDYNPDEIFHVYGWMRPEPLVQWISGWGGSFHETLLSNLSWHHVFPADEDFDYSRPAVEEAEALMLEDKHYVIFIASEGDAGNWVTGFQAGAWHSSARGEVPVGWGFNLHMFEQFPFLAQYYYETATPMDGFISVTSPLGYAFADMFPENILPDAISQSSALLEKFQIPTVYAYKHYNGAGVSTYRGIEISNNYDFDKLGQFAEATGTDLTFLFDPALQTQQTYTEYGGLLYNHVDDHTFYADVTDLDAAADRIISKLKNNTTPNFLLAGYQRFRQDGFQVGPNNPADITLPRLQTLMNKVQADPEIGNQVRFVTPEAFQALLKKSLETTSAPDLSKRETGKLSVFMSRDHNGYIRLELPAAKNIQLEVFDLSGRLMIQESWEMQTAEEHIVLPLQNLPGGMYVLRARGENTVLHEKFIK